MINVSKFIFCSLKRIKKPRILFLLSVVVLAVLGSMYMRNIWTTTMNETSKHAMNIARIAEAGFQKGELTKLDVSIEDIKKQQYKQIKNALIKLKSMNEGVRFVYIYTQKEGKIYFVADSEPPDSKDYSPPGQEYTEAGEECLAAFKDGKELISTPITDRWGTWISILIPMKDFETGKTIAVFGIDYPAQTWTNKAVSNTLQAGVIVFVLFLLLYTFYIILNKNMLLKKEQNKLEFANTESIKANNNFNSFFNTINDMLFVLDTEGKIIHMNNTVYKRLKYVEEELIGKSVLLVYPENRREEASEIVSDMLSSEVKFCSIPVITKHGITIPVETRIVMGEWNGEPALFDVVKDISEIKISEEKFSKAFHSGAILMMISRVEDGCFIDVNEAFLKTLGFHRDEVIGKKSIDLDIFIDNEQRETIKNQFKVNKSVHDFEVLIKGRNDLVHTAILTAEPIIMGEIPYWIMTMTDITERKLVEQALKESTSRLIAAQSMAHVGNWELNLDSENIWASEEVFNIYGIEYVSPYLTSDFILKCTFPEYHELLKTTLSGLITQKGKYDVEYKIKNVKTGEEHFVHSKAILLVDDTGNASKVVGTIQDITERKKKEVEIFYLSNRDQLTGLYNRRFYEEELKRLDTEINLPMTIVMGDVNGLKLINDSFGHVMGDELLNKVAEVIRSGCRADDIIARLGGDEFVIILPKTDIYETEKIIKRIKELSSKEKIGSIDISISFGYETKNNREEKIQEIFKIAEDRMYKKKLFEGPSMRGKTIKAIINTLHEKNKREEAHSHRVSALCKSMGEAIGMIEHEVEELKTVGLLHDIGKTAIDENILNKPGKLTEGEWEEIKRHPEIGYRILSTVNDMSDMANYILYHHERWDGKGYPKGLKGNEIPFVARIITIADAYDAMTSERSYRSALPDEVAIAELQKNAGIQFDPELVSVFIEKVLGQISGV